MQRLESQNILHNNESHCTMSMTLCGETKYSPFFKGITTQGPDSTGANTKEDLVGFVLREVIHVLVSTV